jgi:hypothetical protein
VKGSGIAVLRELNQKTMIRSRLGVVLLWVLPALYSAIQTLGGSSSQA